MSTTTAPTVGIIMGSDSDLPIMQEAAKVLEEFGVATEVTVVSAHRTPERMWEYAIQARGRGIHGASGRNPSAPHQLQTLPVLLIR